MNNVNAVIELLNGKIAMLEGEIVRARQTLSYLYEIGGKQAVTKTNGVHTTVQQHLEEIDTEELIDILKPEEVPAERKRHLNPYKPGNQFTNIGLVFAINKYLTMYCPEGHASPQTILNAMLAGGYKFTSKHQQNRLTTIRACLRRNRLSTFVKRSDGDWEYRHAKAAN